jgi:hypothetical protein
MNTAAKIGIGVAVGAVVLVGGRALIREHKALLSGAVRRRRGQLDGPKSPWRRRYAGFYEAELPTTLDRHGEARTVPVRIQVRHMPEWSGPERWAVEIETIDRDTAYSGQLVRLSDIIASTYAEAKEYALAAVQTGWRRDERLGWVLR